MFCHDYLLQIILDLTDVFQCGHICYWGYLDGVIIKYTLCFTFLVNNYASSILNIFVKKFV